MRVFKNKQPFVHVLYFGTKEYNFFFTLSFSMILLHITITYQHVSWQWLLAKGGWFSCIFYEWWVSPKDRFLRKWR